MGIKTIHIRNGNILKAKALAKELFDYTLKDDPDFHYLFEPDLVLRITTEPCLTKAKSLLQTKNIAFKEYDYPFPTKAGEYGEERHFKCIEMLIHIAFNSGGYSREKEGEYLKKLAEYKLGSV
jgi:hypothetical protein